MWVYLDCTDHSQMEFVNHPSTSLRYIVGFFTPTGQFIWHNAFDSWADAEKQCNYLNGGIWVDED